MKRLPLVALVSAPQDAPTLSGLMIAAAEMDLCVRMISSGQPHRALPATGAVCTGVAMQLEGSVAHALARARDGAGGMLRIAMPSGVITVDASVTRKDGQAYAEYGTLYRTTRRLFEGSVCC